jgi:hypothetical protein
MVLGEKCKLSRGNEDLWLKHHILRKSQEQELAGNNSLPVAQGRKPGMVRRIITAVAVNSQPVVYMLLPAPFKQRR